MDYATDAIYITGMVVRDTNISSPKSPDRTPFGLFFRQYMTSLFIDTNYRQLVNVWIKLQIPLLTL
jgi:hypothetical protein